MALVYRAHFALIARPIFNSKGVNTSALYGFTQTLLDILSRQEPTHIAVAFDTDKPTQRHRDYPEYKATRQAMPEDLRNALPDVRRMIEAFRIPVLMCDGYEADDVIGTLARRAAGQGFVSYMVTPDKDFGQVVAENIFIYKPGRMGSDVEILGPKEVCARWSIQNPAQVVDVLGLMGDSSDNIPGVPGIGEKTAAKLIAQYGSVENLLASADQLSGKLKENIKANTEIALLSKRLATLNCDVPCAVDIEGLKLRERNDAELRGLFAEFEFSSIGRRLFGENFRAPAIQAAPVSSRAAAQTAELDFGSPEPAAEPSVRETLSPGPVSVKLCMAASPADRKALVQDLQERDLVALSMVMTPGPAREAKPLGMALAAEVGEARFIPLPAELDESLKVLREFSMLFENPRLLFIGHDLKQVIGMLKWHGIDFRAKLFDTMVAHSLLEPDSRHTLDYLSETLLGHLLTEMNGLAGAQTDRVVHPADVPVDKIARWAAERADVVLRLREPLETLLREKAQERVFYEIECPLITVLVEMETAGIRVDLGVIEEFGIRLSKEIEELEGTIYRLAGSTFNLNSPKQLGTILFEALKITDAPKKTRTGQYATDEQTLMAFAADHEIVKRLLEHRAASKLKSTYVDVLPAAIQASTGRIHTTYNQVATSTGRLNSQDPNLQNIPIRSERGQEIRRAFVPAGPDYVLLSADYSQIELRIIAALTREAGLIEAFEANEDIHTATAAKVFGVFPEMVTPEMRRKAKMVNFGIAYGISSFGLAQRLNIPRREAAAIIEEYFRQFPGIRAYMDRTIESARELGYVQTVTGRRRYIRDIHSRNMNVRGSAERNAINAPIQGTAADMIKIAMIRIQEDIRNKGLKSRMLLQVHDELVFDLYRKEEAEVRAILQDRMTKAIPLEAPIVVDIGTGRNWLEAH